MKLSQLILLLLSLLQLISLEIINAAEYVDSNLDGSLWYSILAPGGNQIWRSIPSSSISTSSSISAPSSSPPPLPLPSILVTSPVDLTDWVVGTNSTISWQINFHTTTINPLIYQPKIKIELYWKQIDTNHFIKTITSSTSIGSLTSSSPEQIYQGSYIWNCTLSTSWSVNTYYVIGIRLTDNPNTVGSNQGMIRIYNPFNLVLNGAKLGNSTAIGNATGP